MACHLLVNKLLPESMLTKTCHHMASLAHNVSNGHLIIETYTFHQYCDLYAFHALTQVMSYTKSGA